MKNLKKTFNRAIKSDLSWALLFFSAYLAIYLKPYAGLFFGLAFVANILFVKQYKHTKRFPIINALIYLAIYLIGTVYANTPNLVGFILGASISAFLMANYSALNLKQKQNKSVQKLYEVISSTDILQFIFSFNYFFELIIQDVRGQNNLNMQQIQYSVIAFIILSFVVQTISRFLFSKKVDYISYANIVFALLAGISFVIFYFPFLEIGALNIIIPSICATFTVLFINAFVKYSENNTFKFKRTITSLILVFIPLIMFTYYAWNISEYLGMLFVTLSAVTLILKVFDYKYDLLTNFRVSFNIAFLVNLALIIFGLFSLSTKGIITKLNIANIDYLLILILGIFVVYLIHEIRETINILLEKYNMVGSYSVIIVTIISLLIFSVFESGGTEALATLLFGAMSAIFVKNIFIARTEDKRQLTETAYAYVELSLLNLITVIAVSLMLVKL